MSASTVVALSASMRKGQRAPLGVPGLTTARVPELPPRFGARFGARLHSLSGDWRGVHRRFTQITVTSSVWPSDSANAVTVSTTA
jgi:hypothetical protein